MQLFEEANEHSKSQNVQEIWYADMRSQFKKDQARNETGKKSNRRSLVTIRMGKVI